MTPEQKIHRDVLTRYFAVRSVVAQQALAKPDDTELQSESRLLHAAHIFEFPAELLAILHIEADRYVTDVVCEGRYGGFNKPEPGFDSRSYFVDIERAAARLELPEHLPFDPMYLGWGNGIGLSNVNRTLYGLDDRKAYPGLDKYDDLGVVGHLISHERVTEIVGRRDGSSESPGYFMFTHKRRGGMFRHPQFPDVEPTPWLSGYSLVPWVVLTIIQAINAHDTLIVGRPRGLGDRMLAKKLKKAGVIIGGQTVPPMFYSVPIRQTTLQETINALPGPPIEHSHRWDRRGNFAHRIQRGKLPLDEKTRAKLEKPRKDGARYRIYTAANPPPADITAVLLRRKQPLPALGEWVAVLRSWRPETICGPDDKPYVPSTRRLEDERQVRKESTR